MPRAPRLSARLAALARLVPVCRLVYDIGADHALLPIWLIQQGRCHQALATDICPGPLQKAQANIKKAGLTGQIRTRQADGLDGLLPEPASVVVLAGLGGVEIRRILQNSPHKWPVLVIQAMRDLPLLRDWLYANGYRISREKLVLDKSFLYIIFRADYTGEKRELDQLAALVGPRLLEEKPALFTRHLAWLQHKLRQELPGKPANQQLLARLAMLQEGDNDD